MLKIKSLYVSFVKEYFTLNNINLELSPSDKMIVIGSKEKTLNSNEIETVANSAIKKLSKNLGADIRGK